MDGMTTTLTQFSDNSWAGGFIACGDQRIGFILHCEGTTPDDWWLDVNAEVMGIAPSVQVTPGIATCSPLALHFANINFPNPSIWCDGFLSADIS